MIVLGFMQNGGLWTELKDFSDAECDALVDSFSSLPIQLDITPRDGKRGGRHWRTGKQLANWRELEPIALAQAMRTFLDRIR